VATKTQSVKTAANGHARAAKGGVEKKPQRNGHEHVHGPDCNHGHNLICELRIRQYKPQDFKALTAIWKAGDIALDDSDTAKSIDNNLKTFRNGYRLFVAEAQMIDQQANERVGKPRIAGGVVTTYDGHRVYVYHLAVHKEFRGVGLGRALLDTCERQAKLWGARHLRLSARTDSSRDAARKMYEAAGWERDESIRIYRKTL
jgi:ribosomal protein S18 acetylase RimI-like enzyme